MPERLLDLIEGRQCKEHLYNEFDLRVIQMGERKLVTLGTDIAGFGRVQFFLGDRATAPTIEDRVALDLLAIDVGSHGIPLKPEVGTFKQSDELGYTAAITISADLESLDQPLAVVIPADHPLRGWFHPVTWYTLTATVRKRDAEPEPA